MTIHFILNPIEKYARLFFILIAGTFYGIMV